MNRTNDENEIIVLTLWETEYDMDIFYHPSNRAFSEFVDRASPLLESKPERTDYAVSFLEYNVIAIGDSKYSNPLYEPANAKNKESLVS